MISRVFEKRVNIDAQSICCILSKPELILSATKRNADKERHQLL